MRLIQRPGYITGGEIMYYGGEEPKDLLKVDEYNPIYPRK